MEMTDTQTECTGLTAKRAKHSATERTVEANVQGKKEDDSAIITITYVEFYAGIGGWTMALEKAVNRISQDGVFGKREVQLHRMAALDHSDLCNQVFAHNFGSTGNNGDNNNKKALQIQIEKLSLKQVEEWSAKIWAMSPPCQPHTRQHTNQPEDLHDPRSASFLHLCDLIEKMQEDCLPSMVVLENVIGFESSNSFLRWQQVLVHRNYRVGHFHLNPTQVGLPNDRPRYFCVAVVKNVLVDDNCTGTLCSSLLSYFSPKSNNENADPLIITSIPELKVKAQNDTVKFPLISSFLDDNSNPACLRIPDKLLTSNSAWCFDIVTSNDRRSACFTQSYGRFIKGTGSILYQGESNHQLKLLAPEEREFKKDWANDIDLKKLRYFSGTEIARLMGFSDVFSFPPNCSLKQQWKLIGNSLNVLLASKVVELGLRVINIP